MSTTSTGTKKQIPTIAALKQATRGGKIWTPEIAKGVLVLLENWNGTKVDFGRSIGIGKPGKRDGQHISERLHARLHHWKEVLNWKKNRSAIIAEFEQPSRRTGPKKRADKVKVADVSPAQETKPVSISEARHRIQTLVEDLTSAMHAVPVPVAPHVRASREHLLKGLHALLDLEYDVAPPSKVTKANGVQTHAN